ncbi:MAG: phospholipase D-like domain-containing protein [Panacagrimonas sp.]
MNRQRLNSCNDAIAVARCCRKECDSLIRKKHAAQVVITVVCARRNSVTSEVLAISRVVVVMACYCLAGAAGCATLPDASGEIGAPREQQVDFEAPNGPVSEARGEAIVDRLQQRTGASDILQEHLSFEQAINLDSPLVLGNRLVLLQNGPDTYAAMFAAINAAAHHINLETFIFEDDEVGRKFSDLLLQRQAAGVQVNVMVDSVGTLGTPRPFFDRLREGGVQLVEFNPVNPLTEHSKTWLVNNRDHRKLLIVDGRTAFVGGINISDTYSSAPSVDSSRNRKPRKSEGWRDTHMQIDGPVVAEFQKLFIDAWTQQKGTPLKDKHYFPDLKPQGDEIVRAIASTSSEDESPIYLTLLSAISHSQTQVHLSIAYFAPDEQLITALAEAAQRGVDVKLILPSHTDSWAIFHVGRSHYTGLLRSGVRIYQRRGAVMHSKTASIDGVWSTIGSTNLDWRSFLHNEEVNAVILGRDFARQMEVMFQADLEQSDAIELQRWKRRSFIVRLKEWTARLGEYWL